MSLGRGPGLRPLITICGCTTLLAGLARRGRAEQHRLIRRLLDTTTYGNDGDASAVTARIDDRPVVEDASRVAPEPPAREADGENTQAVLAGA